MAPLSDRLLPPLCLPEAQPEICWFKSRPVGWKLGHEPDESQGKPNCIKMAGDSQVLLPVWLGQDTAVRTGAVPRKGCNWMCVGQMIYLLSV